MLPPIRSKFRKGLSGTREAFQPSAVPHSPPAPPRAPARPASAPSASPLSCLQAEPTAALPDQNTCTLLFPRPSPLTLRNQLPQRRRWLIPSGPHPSRLARQQLPLPFRIALQPIHKGLHAPAHCSPPHRPVRPCIGLLQPVPGLPVMLGPIPRLRAPAAFVRHRRNQPRPVPHSTRGQIWIARQCVVKVALALRPQLLQRCPGPLQRDPLVRQGRVPPCPGRLGITPGLGVHRRGHLELHPRQRRT